MNWFRAVSDPAIYPWLCLGLGLCVGSFINVVVYRLPKMMEREWQAQCAELRGEEPTPQPTFNLATPGSACPRCGHRIGMLENIPVLSFIVLGAKCRGCGTAIGWRYPAVELLTGLLSALVGWHFGMGPQGLGILILCWALIALTFIDIDTQLLPDSITLPLLWIGLLFNLDGTFTPLVQAVIGAVAGYLSLWSVYWIFKLATGKEGMGYGDFKLLAALGAWLGWKMLLPIVLLSSVVGAVFGIGLILLARHGRHIPIPFGPYLSLGGFVAVFWGRPILRAWIPLLA